MEEQEKNETTDVTETTGTTEVTETKAEHKKTSNSDDEGDERNKLLQFFINIRSEFNKVIWPSKKEIAKQTATVIVICGIFGAIIVGMDAVLGVLLALFSQYLG